MDSFWHLNLIHLFNFYLGLMFLASTSVRVNQYRALLALVRHVPGRWPRLFQLVRGHGHIFLTWSTALPAVVAFLLFAVNVLATRLMWPQVDLTPADLAHRWLALPLVLVLGAAMLAVDAYATFTVGTIDRELLQQYFDQAEFWLRSWTAPVVRVFTLGFVNPRQMVAIEVRKALLEASQLLNATLWWVAVQVALRVGFGLSLWLTYAWSLTT
jgi:hypothetical protein